MRICFKKSRVGLLLKSSNEAIGNTHSKKPVLVILQPNLSALQLTMTRLGNSAGG